MKRTHSQAAAQQDENGDYDMIITEDGNVQMPPSEFPANDYYNNNDDNTLKKKKRKSRRNNREEEIMKRFDEAKKKEEQQVVRQLFSMPGAGDFSHLDLKPDHQLRPCYVLPNYHIFLETFSPIYRQAYDFLVAIAEPVSRPEHLHEYVLTEYSLYAAVSIGLETEQIIQVLDKLSKVQLSLEVRDFIVSCTSSYGKVNLVLQRNTFFVESPHRDVLLRLLNEPEIASAAILATYDRNKGGRQFKHGMQIDPDTGLLIRYRTSDEMNVFELATQRNTMDAPKQITTDRDREEVLRLRTKKRKDLITEVTEAVSSTIENANRNDSGMNIDDEDDDDDVDDMMNSSIRLLSFEIQAERVEHVKKTCLDINLPMLEEYDFRRDTKNENLEIDLKPDTTIRSYQEKSLSKMFGNGRARSGIIVLPCGAGKTLVGITACCTVKKATLVLCISTVSVEQWKKQFLMWSTVSEDRIKCFTSLTKDHLSTKGADIVIATYNMITYTGNRSEESRRIMDEIKSREWGLMLLDEVHVAPADSFRKVIGLVKAHCSLGLTATLLREDNRTDDIYFLIGPKLYEANWLDLQANGHLARVQCVEVWCPMTPEFYREYLQQGTAIKKLLYVMNPNKFRACEFLIKKHEERGDKIIVFSDNVFALQQYATRLGKLYIYGETHQRERINVLSRFQHDPTVNTVFISKVGDTAIDLPEANVIIQISSHFGSRRQEAQRLGRILRPKKEQNANESGQPNAFFYSLVSQGMFKDCIHNRIVSVVVTDIIILQTRMRCIIRARDNNFSSTRDTASAY